MATIPRGPGANARRAEMMRSAWGHVEKHGSAMLGPILKFLTAHPTLTQGVYYLATGLWPLLAPAGFLIAAGSPADAWMMQTVGGVTAVVGATLCLAAYRRRLSLELFVLAVGCASVFALTEVIFVLQRTISAIHLLDAAAEVGLLALWAYGWGKGRLAWSAEHPALPVAVPLSPTAVSPNGTPYR